MNSRFHHMIIVCLMAIFVSTLLAGCDELSEAAKGANGTAKMQNRRQKRDADALSLGIDDKKTN